MTSQSVASNSKLSGQEERQPVGCPILGTQCLLHCHFPQWMLTWLSGKR
jgi:hypothetical protein